MKIFQDIKIAREMQNLIGKRSASLSRGSINLRVKISTTPTKCAGAVGLFLMIKPKERAELSPAPLGFARQQRRGGDLRPPFDPNGCTRQGPGVVYQGRGGLVAATFDMVDLC